MLGIPTKSDNGLSEKLKKKYIEIAEKSDIYTRFYEDCLVVRLLRGESEYCSFPALESILNYSESPNDILNKICVRDAIKRMVSKHGNVIINGTTYTPIFKNKKIVSYTASGNPYKEFINLLAAPVQYKDNIFYPDEQAVKEINKIEKYRDQIKNNFFL